MFASDLAESQQLENQLAEIFITNYPVQSVITSSSLVGIDVSFPDWDIKVIFDDGAEWLIELKNDKLADKTGSVAIEFAKIINGEWKNSCLRVTAASHWCQYFSNTFYLIKVNTLKQMARNEEYTRIATGGSGGNSRFYLFPVESFIKKAKIIE